MAQLSAPRAAQQAHEFTFHGDTRNDPYAWLSDTKNPDVRKFVDELNEYGDQRTSHLSSLKHTLFEEMKARIQETDMSVPTRMDGYWYYTRIREGEQYAVQCRMKVVDENDWNPPVIDPKLEPGATEGEEIVFDTNKESQGHDFFRIGGMDLSKDGTWMLYGTDINGDERYNFRIRNLVTGQELDDALDGIASACLTPDAQWIFYTVLDDAWRPYAIRRHRVGTSVEDDVEVYHEQDERFWVGVGLSFDERNIVIGTGSKTTTEVLMLPIENPTGQFQAFIPRQEGIEYDVSFARFEGAAPDGADVPLAVVYHNAHNPNFEINIIDLRDHEPPFALGEGQTVAAGSPYGCEQGDAVEPGASRQPVTKPYYNAANPTILQGSRGLGIDGIALHRHFVALSYRANGLPQVAVMSKRLAAENFLEGKPWEFERLAPPALEGDWDVNSATVADSTDDTADSASTGETTAGIESVSARMYSISVGGNPSYEAPRMRYTFSSYMRPGQLRELDIATGEDVLLKAATVLGDFDPRNYYERRLWVNARDGERIPVSLVWNKKFELKNRPMFITGYGAYEISSDPSFSVARLSLLDRGVLYVRAHIRGGGEMGRAWYEQGRRLAKKHTFEDFIDVARTLEEHGIADAAHTVANGGSAGGLLMGAVANMAPECFAGIEADVPFVDALTTILDPSLPLTVTEWDEWGDPLHNAEVYEYMKSYAPYDNVPEHIDGTQFPRILVTTSMNDTRVLVAEPLKWIAKLTQAGADVVAKIEVEAGHGGTSGRYHQWEQVAYENAWCLDVMLPDTK